MEEPKISIIVPVYNTEKYLEQCLDSLLAQTFTDLEIICVDDGSTDNSLKILNDYKTRDERITVITQENQGQYAARNKGVEHSTGEWITFVDSDDWVGENCYETFINTLTNNTPPPDIFMFNGTSFTKDENNPEDLNLRDFFSVDDWKKKSGEICTFKDCKNPFEGNLSVYNKIYRKDFLEEHGINFEKSSIMEDELYWIEAFCAAKSVYLCDEIFYFYRQQPDSTMHNLGAKVFDVFPVFKKIREKLIDYNYYDMAKYAFLQHKFRQYAFFFFNTPEDLRTDFFNQAKQDLSQGKDFDISIVKRLKDNPLYFAFINMNSQEFYNIFKPCMK